jgi:hypothetical protein
VRIALLLRELSSQVDVAHCAPPRHRSADSAVLGKAAFRGLLT